MKDEKQEESGLTWKKKREGELSMLYLRDKKQGDSNGFLTKWICYQWEARKYQEYELQSFFLFSFKL